MSDYNIGLRAFLTIISIVAILVACGPSSTPEEEPLELNSREIFLVEQYLRVVEVRHLATERSSEADSVLAELASVIPVDSIMDIAAVISQEDPERWQPIFQEIERRIELLKP